MRTPSYRAHKDQDLPHSSCNMCIKYGRPECKPEYQMECKVSGERCSHNRVTKYYIDRCLYQENVDVSMEDIHEVLNSHGESRSYLTMSTAVDIIRKEKNNDRN